MDELLDECRAELATARQSVHVGLSREQALSKDLDRVNANLAELKDKLSSVEAQLGEARNEVDRRIQQCVTILDRTVARPAYRPFRSGCIKQTPE